LLGAINALVSLAGAMLLALAIDRLARGHFPSGLSMLFGVLVGRWLLSTAVATWGEHAGDIIAGQWRRTLPAHFDRPRRERDRSRGELALAIDQASNEPSLDLLATSAAVSLVGLVVVFWAAGWLGLVINLGLLAVAVPLYQRAGRRSEAVAIEYDRRRALLESRQLEVLHHTVELRALGAVTFGADEIAAISDSEHAVALRAIRVALESSLVTEFLGGVSIGLVAMVVGLGLLGGRTSLEHALVGVLATSEIFVNVRRYGAEFHRREDSVRSLVTLGAMTQATPTKACEEVLVTRGLITEASNRSVDVVVDAGSRVLVTGPSGSGKTTLLQTLVGWRSPLRGEVRRGVRTIGYVGVDSSLLSGSLRDNLNLGVRISDEDVVERLRSLGLVGPRFEDLDTQLLADGKGISTGERVRLVLARALLAGVALILLDDVGGVLDAEARRQVRSVLEGDGTLAVVEATVDRPVLADFDHRIEVGP
jgi:ABC-type transport system involved in cytochrome bd biosynthesis fused ATPase/permease subunit